MNFLAHALLAEPGSDAFLFGNLIADGVRGSDLSGWPDEIALGIRHHRRIDATIDRHPITHELKARITGPERRVAGIALDVLWDHFLARGRLITPASEVLIERSYTVLKRGLHGQGPRKVPERLQGMVQAMCQGDWLRGYADFEFTCRAISGLGQRLSGTNRLATLIPWLRADYWLLEARFTALWPDMLALRASQHQ